MVLIPQDLTKEQVLSDGLLDAWNQHATQNQTESNWIQIMSSRTAAVEPSPRNVAPATNDVVCGRGVPVLHHEGMLPVASCQQRN